MLVTPWEPNSLDKFRMLMLMVLPGTHDPLDTDPPLLAVFIPLYDVMPDGELRPSEFVAMTVHDSGTIITACDPRHFEAMHRDNRYRSNHQPLIDQIVVNELAEAVSALGNDYCFWCDKEQGTAFIGRKMIETQAVPADHPQYRCHDDGALLERIGGLNLRGTMMVLQAYWCQKCNRAYIFPPTIPMPSTPPG